MESYTEFMNDSLANCKCRGELKAKSDAEVLVGKLCERLDEMGGTEIKTVVIKGVPDPTAGKTVFTPNMTYGEARDMMLNGEPFIVYFITYVSPYEVSWGVPRKVTYKPEYNIIQLDIISDILEWTAAGTIRPEPR